MNTYIQSFQVYSVTIIMDHQTYTTIQSGTSYTISSRSSQNKNLVKSWLHLVLAPDSTKVSLVNRIYFFVPESGMRWQVLVCNCLASAHH